MITRRWLMDEWRDSFTAQTRLRGLPGSVIGEALAEIDAHCADSGQSPAEAFGDPVDYAAALACDLRPAISQPAISQPGRAWVGRAWVGGLRAAATLAGIMCLLPGVAAVAHNTPGVLTAGQLASAAAGAAAVAFIVAAVLRPGQRDLTRRLGPAVAAGLVLVTFPQLIWKQTAFHASGWSLLTAGVLLLSLAWWPRASAQLGLDRIIDPRTGREPFSPPRLLLAAIRWGLPATLLCALLLIVLLPAPPH
jgi:hypothetical protein